MEEIVGTTQQAIFHKEFRSIQNTEVFFRLSLVQIKTNKSEVRKEIKSDKVLQIQF